MNTPNPRYKDITACLALVALAVCLYFPAADYSFITLDDNEYVYDNECVQHGLTVQGICCAFSREVVGHWHPLTMLSHMLDVELFGLAGSGPVRVNICLHIVNALLLYWLARRCQASRGAAAFLAAIFIVHPLNVEGVVWVSQRKSLLSALSFFLSLHAYLTYARSAKLRWYVSALVIFLMGLLCKPMLVTMPVVLLIVDWWPLRRWPAVQLRTANGASVYRAAMWRLVLEKIPFGVLAAASGAVTIYFQCHVGAMSNLHQLGMALRLQNVLMAYCFYLERLIWPFDLGIGYPLPYCYEPGDVMRWGALLVALTLGCYLVRKKVPVAWAGWLWYAVLLLPVSSLLQTGYAVVCDRFGYLPLIGVVAVIIAVSAAWMQDIRWRQLLVWPMSMLCVALLGWQAQHQLQVWRSNISLYEHTLRSCGSSPLIHYNLGVSYFRAKRLDDAIDQYRKALHLHPDYYAALNNLGNALAAQGKYQKAAEAFRAAAAADPTQAAPWNNLATLRSEAGREEEAIDLYHEALTRKVGMPEVHYNLANSYAAVRQYEDAVLHYHKALHATKTPFRVHNNLSQVYLRLGRLEEAFHHAFAAQKIQPKAPPALCTLAMCELSRGNLTSAVDMLRQALAINGRYAEAHLYLGTGLRRLGQTNEGLKHLTQAVTYQPGNAEAQNNLGVALSGFGRYTEAITNLETAVQLAPWFLEAKLNLALCLSELDEDDNALRVLQHADELSPSNSFILAALAWLQATSEDRSVQNPHAALTNATLAVALQSEPEPDTLDTLAIAYALAGRSNEAHTAGARAVRAYLQHGDSNAAARIQARLERPIERAH
jgi:tetratricopeptide (TPR) repeat protein